MNLMAGTQTSAIVRQLLAPDARTHRMSTSEGVRIMVATLKAEGKKTEIGAG